MLSIKILQRKSLLPFPLQPGFPKMLALLISSFFLTTPLAKANTEWNYSSTGEWNGISLFLDLAQQNQIKIKEIDSLVWNQLNPGESVLFFLSPQNTQIPLKKLASFLHKGGVALLAEDFRAAGKVFNNLGIQLEPEPTPWTRGIILSNKISSQTGHKTIRLNHPASFNINTTPIIATTESLRAIFAKLEIGKGQVFLLSDPSVLINEMLSFPENMSFAKFLLKRISSQGNKTIYLLRDFTERTWPENDEFGKKNKSNFILAFLKDLYSDLRILFFTNQAGLRFLNIILSLPFIYLFLFFLSSRSVNYQSPPPAFADKNKFIDEIYRHFALKMLFYKKVESLFKLDPLNLKNQSRIISLLKKNYDSQTASICSKLFFQLSKIQKNSQDISVNKIASLHKLNNLLELFLKNTS